MPYESTSEKKDQWTDDQKARLLAALKAEETQAVGYQDSAEVTQFNEAMNRYFGKPYGDEIKGRSAITTREVYETVAWTLPDLLDIFAAGGRICDLEADQQETENQVDDRADYLDYVFFKDNQGVLILHDFIFDALLHPRAYVDVDWDDEPAYGGWEEYRNLTELQIDQLINAQDTELDDASYEEVQVDPDEAYPTGIAYNVKARKKLRDGCCKIEVCPPEDMFIAGRATDLKAARYKGRIIRWRRSVWKETFPDYRNEIDELSGNEEASDSETDGRRSARYDDGQASDGEWATAANKAAQELIGRKEYIFYSDPEDEKGEGKLLRVYRLADLILDVEEVDDDPFASAVSDRVPHRLNGLSIPEILSDLQKLKTVLTRGLVDGVVQSSVPRIGADEENVNLNDLLNLSHGAVIRTKGSPADKLMPIQTPDLSAGVLQALEWTDQIAEQRTGITRHAQGMDPDSLNHTAKGIQLIQNAANARKRLIARLIAVGVEEMMAKVDRVIQRNQKAPRSVKLGKQWKVIDPRSWSPGMKVTVTVGLGTGAKDVQISFLQMIQQDQIGWVDRYGLETPVVTPKHLFNTVTEKLRVMGYQSPDKFFGEPVTMEVNPETGQPEPKEFVPQPPPSPDQMKIEAQMKEGEARLQMDGQKAQADAQLKQFETTAKAQADIQKAQLDAAIAQQKAAAEIQLMRDKMALEMQMRREQMQFEMQMQREQFEFEKQQSALETEAKVAAIKETAKAKAKPNGSGGVSKTQFGGDPG